ncbi:hypothetical protein HMPREF1531_01552 [Propionibacterium sp. oral taxon 192 str. F0372]|uniref:DUF4411 family protein n=1 Tax=Propionibacterium sp. oral taxon 192 TaxID=671222 RepID=UPI0003544EE6|nr:DUF4411 family protein [Propionibacterium sp. oral taxon 192]EPH03489.1 hypothetical protein HMPREF1531_01552 [Propionibacterium sp. oral taxon 192 str. F0372]
MYLVDANVLIEAKNRYSAFDIAPGFWKWLDQAHLRGTVFSIERVGEELGHGTPAPGGAAYRKQSWSSGMASAGFVSGFLVRYEHTC